MSRKRHPAESGDRAAERRSVFLNLPYDHAFRNLFIAYISGTAAVGLIPRATLEIPGGARRLDRIESLIRSCRYSIHDLSRVQLDRNPHVTPRFNMPFELGLTIGLNSRGNRQHTWFVFEKQPWRLQKSLSDLNGTDVYSHGGTGEGVLRQLLNAFARERRQPTFEQIYVIFQNVKKTAASLQRETGAASLFEASVFRRVSIYATAVSREVLGI